MTLFTSSFRHFFLTYCNALKSIFITLFLIISIELFIVYEFKDREILRKIYRENILNLNFLQYDQFSQYLIGYKNYALFYEKPKFLIIGDSSGLRGLKPLTISKTDNMINLSCCIDTGWTGYAAIARHYLEANKTIRYLILHITPFALPSLETLQRFDNGIFASQLQDIYSSPWRFFYYLPSTFFRKEVTDFIYYQKPRIEPYEVSTRYAHLQYLSIDQDYIEFLKENKGWSPAVGRSTSMKEELPGGECKIVKEDNFHKTNHQLILINSIKKIQNLAKKYNVKLIVSFNPVPCADSENTRIIKKEIGQFKSDNPDVIIPFEPLRTYDKNYFYDKAHLTPEGAEKFSQELGAKLAELLR